MKKKNFEDERKPLDSEQEIAIIEEENSEVYENKIETNFQGSKKRFVILAIVLGVVFIIGGFLCFLSFQKDDEVKKQLALGQKFLDEGNYEEAIIAFDKVLEIDEKKSDAYEGKAGVYLGQKDYGKAEEEIKKAQEINKSITTEIQMAEVYVNTNRPEEGKKLIKEMQGLNNESIEVVSRITNILILAKDYDTAIEIMNNKISGTEDKEEQKKLYNQLIELYVTAGKSEEAIQELLKKAGERTGDPSYESRKEEFIVKIPAFEPAVGQYEDSVTISIQKGDPNDKVFYTIDGSEPSNQSPEYIEPFKLTEGSYTVKVLPYNAYNVKGKIQEAKYTVVVNQRKVSIKGNTQRIKEEILDYYTEKHSPDGKFVIFDGNAESSETDATYKAMIRYQMSDEAARKKIANGGTVQANTLLTSVTVNKNTGVVTDDKGVSWNLW